MLGITDLWTYVLGTIAIVLLPGPNSLFVLSTGPVTATYKTQHLLTVRTNGLPAPNLATITNGTTVLGTAGADTITATVASVLSPPLPQVTTRLVSYQSFYDALTTRCQPSYTLNGGPTNGTWSSEQHFVAAFLVGTLAVGFPVFCADELGVDESASGALWAAFAFGSTLGALGLVRVARRMTQLFAEGLPWRPGAQEALRSAKEVGLRTALVTSPAMNGVTTSGKISSHSFKSSAAVLKMFCKKGTYSTISSSTAELPTAYCIHLLLKNPSLNTLKYSLRAL